MFLKDSNWNATTQRAGWTIDNLHMHEPMIDMAVEEKIAEQRHGFRFTDRNAVAVKAWWHAYAQELCERDPALS